MQNDFYFRNKTCQLINMKLHGKRRAVYTRVLVDPRISRIDKILGKNVLNLKNLEHGKVIGLKH
jgi:hypothetical protein